MEMPCSFKYEENLIARFKEMVISCEPSKNYPLEGNVNEIEELLNKRKRMIKQLPVYQCEYEDMKSRFKKIKNETADMEATMIANFNNGDVEIKYEDVIVNFESFKEFNAKVISKYEEMVECAESLLNILKNVAADTEC